MSTVPTKKHMSETLKTYTLSNGKAIEIRRVSIYTLELATQGLPRPKPPTQEIDGESHENYAHPEYLQAMQDWEEEKRLRRADAIFACGIKADIDQAELADFRAVAESAGLSAPTNDRMCYIKHCLLNTIDDALNVQALIMTGSFPSEEGISEAADSFKSGVEAQADSQNTSAVVGSDDSKP